MANEHPVTALNTTHPNNGEGQPAKFEYQRFQLKLDTSHPHLSTSHTPQRAMTPHFKAKQLQALTDPHEYIDGIIINSTEPHHADKLNYIAYDSENNIGLAQLWGMREALEDREAAGTVHEKAALFNETDWKIVLSKTVLELQNKVKDDHQGSCLLVTIVHKNTIITANLGDSTAYLVVVNAKHNVTTIRLNKILHKPSTKEEYERLKAFAEAHHLDINELVPTGYEGFMRIYNNKLGGKLAISGAIGDGQFDELGLRHHPDIYYKQLASIKGSQAFVITSCDGLTEPSDMEKKIGKLIASHQEQRADKIAEHLVLGALNEGSEDNISVVITPVNPKDDRVKYAAVFDGHGGDRVAEELQKHFHTELNYQVEVRLGLK